MTEPTINQIEMYVYARTSGAIGYEEKLINMVKKLEASLKEKEAELEATKRTLVGLLSAHPTENRPCPKLYGIFI